MLFLLLKMLFINKGLVTPKNFTANLLTCYMIKKIILLILMHSFVRVVKIELPITWIFFFTF